MMSIFFEVLGWVGSFCFIYSYYMLIVKKWKSHQRIYHCHNIVGSVLFVANGVFYLAWAVIFINFVWGCIAFYGLYKTYHIGKE